MDSPNRIIALIDLSDHSENIVKFAEELAVITGASILFVHKLITFIPALEDLKSRKEILEQAKYEALAALRSVAGRNNSIRKNYYVSDKDVLSILQDLKDLTVFDWVLVGLKKTSRLKNLLIGTTTITVIDESDLLTVAVPLNKKIPVPDSLVVAVNPKFPCNHFQLNTVLNNFKEHLRKVEFITVVTESDNELASKGYLDSLRNKYSAFEPESRIFPGGNFSEEIKEYMRGQKNSFLVIQQGSRTLKDSLFRKFTINELVYNGGTPLIVLSE